MHEFVSTWEFGPDFVLRNNNDAAAVSDNVACGQMCSHVVKIVSVRNTFLI